jgi:hypothetical protein
LPLPLNLFKAFEKGEIVHVKILAAAEPRLVSPPKGKMWLLLNGMINNDAEVIIQIYVKEKAANDLAAYTWQTLITTTTAASNYPLWPNAAGERASQFSPVFISDSQQIGWVLPSGAAVAVLTFLEWTP